MSALYGTYARSDLSFERGQGMRLFDQHGRDYLDFHSGIAVNATDASLGFETGKQRTYVFQPPKRAFDDATRFG